LAIRRNRAKAPRQYTQIFGDSEACASETRVVREKSRDGFRWSQETASGCEARIRSERDDRRVFVMARSQCLVSGAGLIEMQRNLIGDVDAVAVQGDNLFGVVGENANVVQAQIN
jgi:hypothetical protein